MKLPAKVVPTAAAIAIATALAGAYPAHAAPARPDVHTYTGHGQITIGSKGGVRFCLGIKGTSYQGRGYPAVYSVRCDSAGVWQTDFYVSITGDSQVFVGHISPIANLGLCINEVPGNITGAIVPCGDAIPLGITDITKPTPANLLKEIWRIAEIGYYFSVTNPVSNEKITRFAEYRDPNYIQLFKFNFGLYTSE